jgi:phosphatidylglycerophosphate synthase
MIDGIWRRAAGPLLDRWGAALAARGIGANEVTLAGLALGLLASVLIALEAPLAALPPLLASRLADGLDGAVARAKGKTEFGGYLDILCDFAFYGTVPFAFVLMDPAANGAAGAFLLLSFYVNGTSFLAFAALAAGRGLETDARGEKSLYFTAGLLEAGETIAFFVLIGLFPSAFAPLAWIFGALCFVTAGARLALARRTFQ